MEAQSSEVEREEVMPPNVESPEYRGKYGFHNSELEHFKQALSAEEYDSIDSDEEYFDHGEGLMTNNSEDESDMWSSEDESNVDENRDAEEWTMTRDTEAPETTNIEDTTQLPRGLGTPYDYFKVVFTQEILGDIVSATNACAADLLSQCTGDYLSSWKDLDIAELLRFLGVIFFMGNIMRTENLRNYYSTRIGDIFHLPTRNFMSRNRFYQIFRCLRFGEDKIDSLINHFNTTMRGLYVPGSNVTINESMILNEPRPGHMQFVVGKLLRYSIKLYSLQTPNGITIQIQMHHRNDVEGDNTYRDEVVAKLMSNYLNAGRQLYLSTHFSNVKLAEFLLKNKTNVTGMLQKKMEGNPAISNKKMKRGERVYRFNRNGICVLKWCGLYISTNQTPDFIPTMTKQGKTVLKPEIVDRYENFVKSIKGDDLYEFYSGGAKRMRWYKKAGIHILQLMLLNAYYFYQIESNSDLTYHEFRKAITTTLLLLF